MERKILKPGKPGLIVRDPVSKNPLSEKGEEKLMNTYWYKRVACGDALIVENEKEVEKKDSKK